jgi:hypothetical protein
VFRQYTPSRSGRAVAKGGAVSGPFIFIATNRLKPGKLDAERNRVPGLVDFVEANEPQLLAFNEYVNEEGTEVGLFRSTLTPTR